MFAASLMWSSRLAALFLTTWLASKRSPGNQTNSFSPVLLLQALVTDHLHHVVVPVVSLAKPSGGWRRSLPTEAPSPPHLVSWQRGEERRQPKERSTRRFQQAKRRKTRDSRISRRGKIKPKERTWRRDLKSRKEEERNSAGRWRVGPTLAPPRWSNRRAPCGLLLCSHFNIPLLCNMTWLALLSSHKKNRTELEVISFKSITYCVKSKDWFTIKKKWLHKVIYLK